MDPYYVSDLAYSHLTRLAVQARYVSPRLKRQHNMSSFLNVLSEQEFFDNRSAEQIAQHEEEFKARRMPSWRVWAKGGDVRVARMLRLSDKAIVNYCIIAYEFGVVRRSKQRIIREPRTPAAVVSLVLEAIGVKMLVPVRVPSEDFSARLQQVEDRKRLASDPSTLQEEDPINQRVG